MTVFASEDGLDDLLTAPEIGRLLGVTEQRVYQILKENPDFPEPELVEKRGTPARWLRSDVEAWFEENPRRPKGWPRSTNPICPSCHQRILPSRVLPVNATDLELG